MRASFVIKWSLVRVQFHLETVAASESTIIEWSERGSDSKTRILIKIKIISQLLLVKDGRYVPVVRYQIAQIVFPVSQVVEGEIKRHRRVTVQVAQ